MKYSATEFTPKEARKPRNQFAVRLSFSSSSKRSRIYPEIDKGDEVKIFRKRKPNEKERIGNFSRNVYTIERIEKKLCQSHYYVKILICKFAFATHSHFFMFNCFHCNNIYEFVNDFFLLFFGV